MNWPSGKKVILSPKVINFHVHPPLPLPATAPRYRPGPFRRLPQSQPSDEISAPPSHTLSEQSENTFVHPLTRRCRCSFFSSQGFILHSVSLGCVCSLSALVEN
uniref:Uncharacterized protein n=1 Tax=Cucumis melo TaxID=3656 RepID=A0A9I9EAJ5_CUCME